MTRALIVGLLLAFSAAVFLARPADTAAQQEAQPAWVVDQICLARYADGVFWYPARITEVGDNGQFKVQYFDGDEEWRTAEQVRPERLKAEDPMGALFEDGYKDGVLLERKGMKFTLGLPDGSRHETTITFVRTFFEE